MSEQDEKPGRKKLSLTAKTEAAGHKRKPARWSPLQRDRSQAPAKPAEPVERAEEARPRTRPAGPAKARTKGEAAPRRQADGGRPAPGPDTSAGRAAPRRRATPKAPVQLKLFVPCPRGLEAELAAELGGLGAAEAQAGSGGVHCQGDVALAWRINLWSRLAIRVLQEVATGDYRSEDDLYRAAVRLPWSDWFGVDKTIAVRTVAHASPLKSLNFVTLRIKDAVVDRFRQDLGERPSVDAREPQVPILAYLDRERFSLYLDLSGEPLNRRGYRVEPAPAPLNENLAAGLLRLSGWTPDTPLLDPMMGGGTILLEAAMMALDMAPGLKRHFAFEHLASFDKVEWTRLRKDAEAARKEARPLPIYGCDIDPRMIRAAGLNLKAAGLLDCVTLREGDVTEIPAPAEHGLIVSNPPYGVRLDSDAGFYKGLGDALKRHFSGWAAWLISSDAEFPKHIGLAASRRVPLYNGPLECRLYEYRLVAGTMRKKAP
ncbi:class I SAM-dependent RNA methyltransferase [Parasulfuritortus cantonensis]|uniref:Class I SAM-dependent RNA methyltransferase n=1 Tax=Parasulfuritortus cantonensis TaxID=2528202 RepID=A0A4R1B8F4_9PROT|nr:THUMP domain-containing protein [Parasulfuritortus cantonensis]TCJ12895.1 class I SAM-dependent RNA methyltransferase [Parasulfuritortus cantonensis]